MQLPAAVLLVRSSPDLSFFFSFSFKCRRARLIAKLPCPGILPKRSAVIPPSKNSLDDKIQTPILDGGSISDLIAHWEYAIKSQKK
jgi:hypothetical protein